MPDTDTFVLPTYLGYLTLSIAVTVWVARTLHRNGRAFLSTRSTGRSHSPIR